MASGAAGPHEVQRLPGPVIGGRMPARSGLGPLLRDWRQRRRLSQLGLATEAGISARHLSFVETGRARASRALLLQLAELLELPLRERNRLLLAGGYAPQFVEHAWADPTLASAHAAVQRILTAHEPYPALAVDRHWNLLMSNRVADALLARGPRGCKRPLDPRADHPLPPSRSPGAPTDTGSPRRLPGRRHAGRREPLNRPARGRGCGRATRSPPSARPLARPAAV